MNMLFLGQTQVPPPAPTGNTAIDAAKAVNLERQVKNLNLKLAAQEDIKKTGLMIGAVSLGMRLISMFKGK